MTDNNNIIEINNLTKIYRKSKVPAVNDVSLSIRSNEIFGLLGPNGAGKTTTISILCGLFPQTSGNITVKGMDLAGNLEDIKKVIGVVPQEIALYPTLTAHENLRFFGRMYGLGGKTLEQRIGYYLQMLNLENAGKKKISAYSGGMKRRVNLIAGLLHEPEILFLDEPTAGSDVQSRRIILDRLQDNNKKGTTIIYTSHYLEEAENFCTRIAIIDYGKIILEGKPEELINSKPEYTNLESIFLSLTGRHVRD